MQFPLPPPPQPQMGRLEPHVTHIVQDSNISSEMRPQSVESESYAYHYPQQAQQHAHMQMSEGSMARHVYDSRQDQHYRQSATLAPATVCRRSTTVRLRRSARTTSVSAAAAPTTPTCASSSSAAAWGISCSFVFDVKFTHIHACSGHEFQHERGGNRAFICTAPCHRG